MPSQPTLLPRERFARPGADAAEAAVARTLLPLLLHQNGSTTRLLEMLAGGPVTVHVIAQDLVDRVPPDLAGSLPGTAFLRRLTTLEAGGQVLLDSLAYIAADILPADVVQALRAGREPIGHLLAKLWTRRDFDIAGGGALLQELWQAVGEPDAAASRACAIATPEGTCMVLAETFRAGIPRLAEAVSQLPRPE